MKQQKLSLIIYLLFISLTFAIDYRKADHPEFYTEPGGCPGESCSYGKWQVQKETMLYADPNTKSAQISKCISGSKVIALTGHINSIAGKFIVKKKRDHFNPGDIIWVYSYLGEGFFNVWVEGGFKTMELGFSPWGGSSGSRCENGDFCWGELENELKFNWWIKIQNVDGSIGWTYEYKNFSYGRY